MTGLTQRAHLGTGVHEECYGEGCVESGGGNRPSLGGEVELAKALQHEERNEPDKVPSNDTQGWKDAERDQCEYQALGRKVAKAVPPVK